MLLNYGVGEDSWESLGLLGDPTSPSQRRSVLDVHWKDWCWSWIFNTLATWLIGKDPDAGKDRGQEEKGMTEDEMVGWHHQFNGHGFGWAPGVGDGQGGLACCNSWGRKESDTTEQLNWTEMTRWMKKQIVVYPQNRIKLNIKKKMLIFSMWINLKTIIFGEKKRQITYDTITYVYSIGNATILDWNDHPCWFLFNSLLHFLPDSVQVSPARKPPRLPQVGLGASPMSSHRCLHILQDNLYADCTHLFTCSSPY